MIMKHQQLYNTTSNMLFTGDETYYFKPDEYDKLVQRSQIEMANRPYYEPYHDLVRLRNMPVYDIHMTQGQRCNWWDNDRPEGWLDPYNIYEVTSREECWFIVTTKPDFVLFDINYIKRTGVVCKDPWEYRLQLIDEGYIEVSSSDIEVEKKLYYRNHPNFGLH